MSTWAPDNGKVAEVCGLVSESQVLMFSLIDLNPTLNVISGHAAVNIKKYKQ